MLQPLIGFFQTMSSKECNFMIFVSVMDEIVWKTRQDIVDTNLLSWRRRNVLGKLRNTIFHDHGSRAC